MRKSIPLASRLMVDAARAVTDGDFDKALELKEKAEQVEPRLRRAFGGKASKIVQELPALLRVKWAAGPVMRQIRQVMGLTQQQMAEICDVTQVTVAHWESGRQAMREGAIERLLRWMAERGVESLNDGPPPAAFLKLRTSLGFTSATLATKLGVKEPTVRRIETGNMPAPIDVIARYRDLASQHGLDLDQLAA